ncbi:MAG TPA: ABC transporter ATP-binding protein, partial [Burkholderiaceae bacterium]
VHDAMAAIPVPSGALGVQLQAVCFSHAGAATPVFDSLDWQVRPGERVALWGPSGAGKSTLLALIAGLAPVQSGQIIIGGVRLGPESAAALRARMAWVGQKPHVFSGSLRSNVMLGRPGISAQALEQALGLAALQDLAHDRADVVLGEGGVGLSGGEALRLALARAACAEQAGLLLADEPTAHLDSQTAQEVMHGLLALAQGRTLIVATHDPLLAAQMDRVLPIDFTALRVQTANAPLLRERRA